MSLILTRLVGFGNEGAAAPVVITTWDSGSKNANMTLSNSNRTTAYDNGGTPGAKGALRSVDGKSSGKWYLEIVMGSATFPYFGICSTTFTNNAIPTTDAQTWALRSNGTVYVAASSSGSAGTYTNNSIVQIAFDADAGSLWFGVGNTYTGSPSAGTGASVTGLSGTKYAYASSDSNTVGCRIDDTPTYSPPTGFSHWG